MICGRAMVMHVIHALEGLQVDRTVLVVGHGAERVTKKVQEQAPAWANVSFVEQTVQRGTGDAALVGMTVIPGDDLDDDSTVLILPGDTPLLTPDTLVGLVAAHLANGNAATLTTSVLDDPTGYGRVVRGPSKAGEGRVLRIVEQRDANDDERAIREVNMGMYAFRRDLLGPALRHLSPDNAQGEYYLTDVIGVLASMGHRVGSFFFGGFDARRLFVLGTIGRSNIEVDLSPDGGITATPHTLRTSGMS
jgi:bifunctional UDP-N-acetylglucosamine pyrophosphorylase/glucosamine-1-phosphate N-acetyltransferase